MSTHVQHHVRVMPKVVPVLITKLLRLGCWLKDLETTLLVPRGSVATQTSSVAFWCLEASTLVLDTTVRVPCNVVRCAVLASCRGAAVSVSTLSERGSLTSVYRSLTSFVRSVTFPIVGLWPFQSLRGMRCGCVEMDCLLPQASTNIPKMKPNNSPPIWTYVNK